MSQIKHASVAGLFYPAEGTELRRQVQGFLAQASTAAIDPKALVAPHAGFDYSGPVAAQAYGQIARRVGRIRRVVLLGPTHRMPVRGLVYSSAEAFRTPLGDVPVDRGALESVAGLPQVAQSDAPFTGEHCLEVQLPFLQETLEDFEIVPLLVGDADGAEVAEVLERLWGGDETLIVISSDLSHFLDYEQAQALDRLTSQAIEQLDPNAIGYDQACGRNPLKGLLLAARRHGLRAEILDLRNSGDTAGPKDRVVGYGAYGFH